MKTSITRQTHFLFILTLGIFLIMLSGCGGEGGGGSWIAPPSSPGDTISPVASFTSPVSGATLVATGTKLTVTFSEAMNPATLTTTTFTLFRGIVQVPGTVSYVGLVATFTPTAALLANTLFTATITTGAKDLAGNSLASNYSWTFTTGAGPDITPPTVTLTDPLNGAGVVALNKKIAATFSEAMDPATITTATFTLQQTVGLVAVPGAVTYAGLVATFTPSSALVASTNYTATITTGATDLAVPANALAANYVWTFTTGAGPDITPPTVTLTDPASGAAGVPLNQKIAATFSEAMDPATLTAATFTLKQGVTAIPGTVTVLGLVATFTPNVALTALTPYTATISAGAKDLAGNALVVPAVGLPANPWTFTTGAGPDITPPTITLTDPVNVAVGVALNKKVQATFSESMDPATLTNLTFTLKQGLVVIPGTVGYVGLVATFTPTSALTAGLVYTAEVTTGAKDLAGNALVVPAVGLPPNPWTFTTIAPVPLGPLPVNLGTAADFAILSKSGITNVPPSLVTGDIGVSPISFTSITGFTLVPNDASAAFSTALPQVVGNVYAADYQVPTPAKMTAAISDMETAYVDAAGRVGPDGTELGAGNLTGLNLAPGLYKWSTGVSVNAAGTVTLTGTAVDVWILQIAGDITMNPGSRVTLAGGALAQNVFWQIGGGTGVTLDTGVAFQGNILAAKAITMNALATVVNGRLLSQTSVTMISNTVTKP